jgi:2-polyprenyl-3-methyl-5-hydroxy-6-metoxy-1,4-benzoquinol methylase
MTSDYRITDDEIRTIEAVEMSHWWYRGMREIVSTLLEPFLPAYRPLRVLDIGCGTGGNLLQLAALGEVQGLDPSALCVDYCRRKGLICVQGSMSDLGGLKGPFDLVTMFDVLNQANPSETIPILRGIRGIVSPGGLLVFREPALPIAGGAHDRAVGIQQRFTIEQVRAALTSSGFEPLRVTYLNTLLFAPIVLRRRAGDIVSGGTRVRSDVHPTAAPLNALLLGVLRIEREILKFVDMPFGVSLFAAARRPPERPGASTTTIS